MTSSFEQRRLTTLGCDENVNEPAAAAAAADGAGVWW